ncbi:MAG: D-alanine--D-alanine ligase [Bryobacterales bacterium]|jgi:D-alanine-D-alanine ligase|nr:D-alanine--D-alanine ligase [Bryobacterales bacterium]
MTPASDLLRVAVLSGGRSGEHEVSLVSAQGVMAALDPDRFTAIPCRIGPDGAWLDFPIVPQPRGNPGVDVVFPVLHGTFGEDGAIQGLLELADLPYVGPGVLSSALCMDKIATKRTCAAVGVPVVDFLATRADAPVDALIATIQSSFGFPCFVKPANLGSSVGISKAHDAMEFRSAFATAACFDTSILVERAIVGQELECAILGNEDLQASVVGEIVPGKEFYDYEDKYHDGKAQTLIPARISADDQTLVRALALQAARALQIEGMARVDFFRESATGAIFLNEVNTIPGFTPISMYSKMWEATGLPYRELLTCLITLALQRHDRRRKLRFSR